MISLNVWGYGSCTLTKLVWTNQTVKGLSEVCAAWAG